MSQVSPTAAHAPAVPTPFTRRNAGYVFWLLWFANFINYADRYAFIALGAYVQTQFGFSDTQLGLLASSFLFVYTISILPLGLLADRIKRKLVVAGGITFWSIVTAITAISPNYGALFATRAALGLGEGSYFPASTSMLASSYPGKQRARVMSRWNTGLLAGLAVGFVGAGVLYGVFNNHWQPVFYVFGIPGLILATLIFLMKEPPRHANDDDVSAETALAREGIAGIWRNIVELLRIPTLRITVAMQALSFFVFASTLVFIVPLLTRQFPHMAISPTTLIGVATVIGGIIGLLAGGAIADGLIGRYPGARVLVSGWGFILSLPTYIAAALVVIFDFGLSQNVRVFGLFAPLLIITVALLQVNSGPLTAVSQDVVTPLKRASAVGLTLLLSHALGDLFSPTIAGGLSDFLSGNAFFQSLGVTHSNSPGYAFLFTGVPVLLAAGIVGIWGSRFVKPDLERVRASAGTMAPALAEE
jgi:MFS transporter, Spinster family, sphingosine-1-phosphate transporter